MIVAVALVTGQALLCGVIGFLTFGDRGGAAPPRPRAAEPLAGPPIVVPAPTMPAPSGSSRAPRRHGKAQASSSSRPARPTPAATAPRRSSEAPAPRPDVTSPAAPASRPASEPPAPISLIPPEPPEESDEPAVVGEPCDEAGATGRTAGGRAVRCERDRDGDLRWQPV